MVRLETGVFIEATNRHTGRMMFSVATDQINEEAFLVLWQQLGKAFYHIYEKRPEQAQLEIRVTPIRAASER